MKGSSYHISEINDYLNFFSLFLFFIFLQNLFFP